MVYESIQVIALYDMGTVQVLPVKVLSCRNVDCFDGSFLLLDAGKQNRIVPLIQEILSYFLFFAADISVQPILLKP